MTDDQLAAVVRGLTPHVRDIVRKALAEQAAAVAQCATRVAALETDRPAIADLPGLRDRVTRLEATTAAAGDVPTVVSTLRERVAVLEARPPQPGPPGPPGIDDIKTEYSAEEGFVVKFFRGDTIVGETPLMNLYDGGAYRPGSNVRYRPGALVSWDGSMWLCREATTSAGPLDTKAWRLAVKRGTNGRDGKDAPAS